MTETPPRRKPRLRQQDSAVQAQLEARIHELEEKNRQLEAEIARLTADAERRKAETASPIVMAPSKFMPSTLAEEILGKTSWGGGV